MRLPILNGPNLNMLGVREPTIYSKGTLSDLEKTIRAHCEPLGILPTFFQSNHEGALVDRIQQALVHEDAMLINPAAHTHTSIAILDAIKAVGIPTVEVHLSNIAGREPFRQHNYISPACIATIAGRGFQGYLDGIDALIKHMRAQG